MSIDSLATPAVAGRTSLTAKVPPHSVEAEQSVLGGLLLDNDAWDQIIERVHAKDFYRKNHALIFQAIRTLTERNQPVDAITLIEQLKEMGKLDVAGGEVYIFELANNTPSAANITAYADIVRDRSILRQLITVTSGITEEALQPQGRPSKELLDEAEKRVFDIAEQNAQHQGPASIGDLLTTTVAHIDELFHSDESFSGLPTGYKDLDELTSGLQKADLLIIAGRPSMGKTVLGINIAEHVAIASEKPVLVFSMEMPNEAIAMRMLSSLGRIDQHRLRTGKLKDEDWSRISSAVNILSSAKMFIDDTPALSPSDLRARARRLTREQGPLGLIVIDYLQLMQVPGYKENRTNEISAISRSLKSLAKELNVPVIALSQLNRSLEQRPNKRPIMADLRESGAIEQDADVIAFIYRDEVYNDNTPEKGIAEIIVAKQRNGPIGTVRLTFLGQYTRFENFARDGVI